MKWLRLTLIAQLLFFVGWAAVEETRKTDAVEFLLETRPVDPRDFLRGHYMILRYAHLNPRSMPNPSDGRVWVQLAYSHDHRWDGQRWPVWRAKGTWVKHRPARLLSKQQGWASGTCDGRRMAYGIERYYFSEKRKEELNSLRGGSFMVKARLSPDGTLRVMDLIWGKTEGEEE